MGNLKSPKLRLPEFEEAWGFEKLGILGEVITGSTPPTNDKSFYEGEYLFVSPVDIQGNRYVEKTKTTLTKKGFLKGRKIRKGSSLFVCIGSTIGKLAQAKAECITNQQINSVVPINNNDDFVFSLLEFHADKIQMLSANQAVPILNKTTFSNYHLSIPSLPEQTKIASFLTAVDEKLQGLKKKKALLEQYKKGVIQQLFSRQLRFKDDNGQPFPDWEEKKLGEIAEKRIKKNRGSNVKNVFTNSASEGIVNQRDFFDKDIANQNNIEGYYIVDKNDFIYNPRISNQAPVGPISRNKIGKGIMSPLYSVFCFKVGNLDFIEYFFQTKVWHLHMENIANYGARADRMSFAIGDFYKMPIPFPIEAEQSKIVNFLSAIDEKINTVQNQIEKTESWKKGLLQQMFV